MANPVSQTLRLALLLVALAMATQKANALIPYTRSSLWDLMLPTEDPFRILEQNPLSIPNGVDGALALARADWKESAAAHVITLDVPGMKKEDIKVEVEENRVLRVSGERRKKEDDDEGKKNTWHTAERTSGKFLRQFRMPGNADLEHVEGHLEDGVLKIVVPKLPEEKKKQPKLVVIGGGERSSGEDITATKAEK